MNKDFIEKWNNKVSMGDIVYYIGDFSFLNIELSSEIFKQLNGEIHLIKGNHDRKKEQMIKIGFKSVNDYLWINIEDEKVLLCHYPFVNPKLSDVAVKRPNIMSIKNEEKVFFTEEKRDNILKDYDLGLNVLLSIDKVPLNRNSEEKKKEFNFVKRIISKYIGSRPINKGQTLIHGHTHNTQKHFLNSINVSVEAWDYEPVSSEAILKIIKQNKKDILSTEYVINNDNFLELKIKLQSIKDVLGYSNKYDDKFLGDEDFIDKRISYIINKINICNLYKIKFEENEKYLKFLPKSPNKEYLEIASRLDMYIKKEDLIVGSFYNGTCRNARLAMWNGNNFIHIRHKFGMIFLENILCPNDDDGFDVFIPHKEYSVEDEECIEDFNLLKSKLDDKD
jgi:calcineurin-like phosphoesterase family protein